MSITETIGSEYISASAGSGKTYALSSRYQKLLLSGVPPESICALTFTRAATGEILDGIVSRLIENHNLDDLRNVLEKLPRLQISTIDAFSSHLARLFAYELGLNPDFMLYEEGNSPEGIKAQRESVQRLLQNCDRKNIDSLLDVLDVKHENEDHAGALMRRLMEFLADFSVLAEKQPTGWGDLSLMAAPFKECTSQAQRESMVASLRSIDLNRSTLTDKQKDTYQLLLDEYHAEIESVKEMKACIGKRWSTWSNENNFGALYTTGRFGQKKSFIELNKSEIELIKALWDDLLARDLRQTAEHTQHLYQAVKKLNEAHQEWSTETGRISFSELTRILSHKLGSQLSISNPDLLSIIFRMDSDIRHLMIDEFQDTSTEQWRILSNIASELAAKDSQDGTFFYVGDVKQSIYGWRGGDSTLFGDTTRVPLIPEGEKLLASYRSCPTIIKFVNQAMTFQTEDLSALEIWKEPIKEWQAHWMEHRASEKTKKELGFVEALTLPEGKKSEWMESLAKFIANRFKELSGHGKSIAVLAFQNSLFQPSTDSRFSSEEPGLLKRLRDLGIPCAIDGKRSLADTSMGRLIVMLLRWLADPRATLWAEVAQQLNLFPESAEKTYAIWCSLIAEHGFVAWLNVLFGQQSVLKNPLSPYDSEVLHAIRQGIEQLEESGVQDADALVRALSTLTIPCSADAGTLSLMTIHHSKGLTFDVVFTVLYGKIINEQSDELEQGQMPSPWVLEKPVLAETYKAVPALLDARRKRYEMRFKDSLCCLYVAITRARNEQIIIAPEKEITDFSTRASILFKHLSQGQAPREYSDEMPTFSIVWREGDRDWMRLNDNEAMKSVEKTLNNKQEPTTWKGIEDKQETKIELPSEQEQKNTLAHLLEKTWGDARINGVSIHNQLAQIAWSHTPPQGLFTEVFQRPSEPCELWRERSFSVRLSNDNNNELNYSVGQFDRVHLFSNRAVIYDFKTSRTPMVTAAYRKQLADYRKALVILTGLAPKAIETVLLFTQSNTQIRVEP